jgi:hypothetical protein
MKNSRRTVGVFLMGSCIAAATMYLIGWRSMIGIVGTALGAGLTVAFVTKGGRA